MLYVIDTSALIDLFDNYYLSRFPTMWGLFDSLVECGSIVSVREAFREIESFQGALRLVTWSKAHQSFFEQPTPEEIDFVRQILMVPHFQQLLDKKKVRSGGPVADPFVIAKAKARGGFVVTHEKYKNNAARIPNVCKSLSIPYLNLEEFMEKENWLF